jgi:predicted DNA binding CopG/RHH family protein
MTEDNSKKPMSREEREARRAAVGRAAHEKVSKSEQLNFRLESASIRALQAMAFQKGLPLGAMIRDWVLDRLKRESSEATCKAEDTASIVADLRIALDALNASASRLNSLPPSIVLSPHLSSHTPKLSECLLFVQAPASVNRNLDDAVSPEDVSTWADIAFQKTAFRLSR